MSMVAARELDLSPHDGAKNPKIWEDGWVTLGSGSFDTDSYYDIRVLQNGDRYALALGDVSGTEAREISELLAKTLLKELS